MNFFLITPFVLQTFAWPFMWVILTVFGRIKVFGREHLRGHKSGAIFAVNHSSQFDPILIPATLNPFSPLMPMFYLARERSFYNKTGIAQYIYGGLFFKIWGAYPVTVGTKGNYDYALRNHINILRRGQSVCIFPEGKINRTGKMGDGRPGTAYLSWSTGRPIIPVAIHGHVHMRPSDFFSRTHSISVMYGNPISREELFACDALTRTPTQDELKVATSIIMSRIREMYERI